jgi:ArsR family transcriptional regulator
VLTQSELFLVAEAYGDGQNTCIMVQVRKKTRAKTASPAPRAPATPRAAAACRRPVDGLLDPVLFQALGDPTRVQLLACLMKCGRACLVNEVAACCVVDLSVVSRHLKVLAGAGIVESSRSGRLVSYRVRYESLAERFRQLASAIEECAPSTVAPVTNVKLHASRKKSPCDGGQNGCC